MKPKMSISHALLAQLKSDPLLIRLYPAFVKACDEGNAEAFLDNHPEFFHRMIAYAEHPGIKVDLGDNEKPS